MKDLNKKFFTFEGVEGGGKSTITKMLFERLKKEGCKDTFLTREPGGHNLKFAENIREIILNNEDIVPYTELFLFEATRREHFEKVILPNLKKGMVVLCDRFTDSTIVYQGLKGVDINDINFLNNIATMGVSPFKTFILDIDPKISIERIKKNNEREMNKFDNADMSYHIKVRDEYLKLQHNDPNRYILINADQTVDKVVDNVYNLIKGYLN